MPVLRELVPPEPGYLTRLEAFAHEHEERLEHLYDRFGTGSEHVTTGRYALVRQPEGLILIERLATFRHDVLAAFDGELEDATSLRRQGLGGTGMNTRESPEQLADRVLNVKLVRSPGLLGADQRDNRCCQGCAFV